MHMERSMYTIMSIRTIMSMYMTRNIHSHDQEHAGEHQHHHEHRGLPEIPAIIRGDLPGGQSGFSRFLQEAEAKRTVCRSIVHFTVGAVDSVDIVAAAVCPG